MRKAILGITTLCLGMTLAVTAACGQMMQQDKSKRPSPAAKATADLGGGKSVTVDYSSPKKKGRTIYGGLVPYGEVWRTGANEATTLTTNADLNINGTVVPAGTYTVFTIPEKDKWTLIISKKTGEWGTDYPGKENDLARIPMKVSTLPTAVEDFTISFGPNGSTLNIDWDTTRASVPVAKK